MPELKSSSRVALKATYVVKDASKVDRASPNAVLLPREPPVLAKLELLRGLRITDTEARRLTEQLHGDDRETLLKLLPIIAASESRGLNLYSRTLADIPGARLIALAKAIEQVRLQTQMDGVIGGPH